MYETDQHQIAENISLLTGMSQTNDVSSQADQHERTVILLILFSFFRGMSQTNVLGYQADQH